MKKKSYSVSEEDMEFLCANQVVIDAYGDGGEAEHYLIRNELEEEGLGFFLVDCLLNYDTSEFNSLVNVLKDLMPALERERAKSGTAEDIASAVTGTSQPSATDRLGRLFSLSPGCIPVRRTKDERMAEMVDIRAAARIEGAEMKRESIAERMQRLGFPSHSIFRMIWSNKGMEEGMEEGMEMGMEEGMKKSARDIAMKLKETGEDRARIAMFTGLSEEEMEKL